jgi:transformation/transcription domain-associated protein
LKPIYSNGETVPFRFTPNMQRFIGSIFTEGIMATGLMAIGRALTDPEVIKIELYARLRLTSSLG